MEDNTEEVVCVQCGNAISKSEALYFDDTYYCSGRCVMERTSNGDCACCDRNLSDEETLDHRNFGNFMVSQFDGIRTGTLTCRVCNKVFKSNY